MRDVNSETVISPAIASLDCGRLSFWAELLVHSDHSGKARGGEVSESHEERKTREREELFRNMERVAQGNLRCDCGNDNWERFAYVNLGVNTIAACVTCGRTYDYKADVSWKLSSVPTPEGREPAPSDLLWKN